MESSVGNYREDLSLKTDNKSMDVSESDSWKCPPTPFTEYSVSPDGIFTVKPSSRQREGVGSFQHTVDVLMEKKECDFREQEDEKTQEGCLARLLQFIREIFSILYNVTVKKFVERFFQPQREDEPSEGDEEKELPVGFLQTLLRGRSSQKKECDFREQEAEKTENGCCALLQFLRERFLKLHVTVKTMVERFSQRQREKKESTCEKHMELPSTHTLQQDQQEKQRADKEATLTLQRQRDSHEDRMSLIQSNVDGLAGEVISDMLDFLPKELVRRQEERRIHDVMIMAERDRRLREAEESGRRQAEEQRRREEDEIFRQAMKVHKASSDLFLEDLMLKSINETAEAQAREEMQQKAEELNIMQVVEKQTLCLPSTEEEPVPRPTTPRVDEPSDEDEEKELAVVFLQKLLRGRSIQKQMLEACEKHMELIQELRSTHTVLQDEQEKQRADKEATLALQRQRDSHEDRMSLIQSNVDGLAGEVISDMLDFLPKELVRRQEERRIHDVMIMAERDRRLREAEESGRRQAEEQRRREEDEIFRQTMKVHKASSDLFLEDLILKSINETAEAQAREEMQQKAEELNNITSAMEETRNLEQTEEIVADFVYNFLLPDVSNIIAQGRSSTSLSPQTRAATSVPSLIIDQVEEAQAREEIHQKAEELNNITSAMEETRNLAQSEEIANDLFPSTCVFPETTPGFTVISYQLKKKTLQDSSDPNEQK